MNMNMDFIKGFSVGIVILILYVFLQPQNGRYYPLTSSGYILLDTSNGERYKKEGTEWELLD